MEKLEKPCWDQSSPESGKNVRLYCIRPSYRIASLHFSGLPQHPFSEYLRHAGFRATRFC